MRQAGWAFHLQLHHYFITELHTVRYGTGTRKSLLTDQSPQDLIMPNSTQKRLDHAAITVPHCLKIPELQDSSQANAQQGWFFKELNGKDKKKFKYVQVWVKTSDLSTDIPI